MTDSLTIWTFDWVPQGPRGHVRDIRLRWAAEEAGLPYTLRTVPFDPRSPDHLAHQPFAQVPFLTEGPISLFESGACLLHLGEKSETLLPRDPAGRAETLQWLFAALNSIEMVSVPWWFIGLSSPPENPLEGWLTSRLDRLQAVLSDRDWLAAGRFSLADVLRVPTLRDRLTAFPALRAYTDRLLDRPAFRKAHQDQLAHFAAADAHRA